MARHISGVVRNARLAVAAGLMAATAVAVPAAAKTSVSSLPAMRGVNVFTGSSSGTMLLRLQRRVHLTYRDIAITGRGRFYGFVLEQNAQNPRQVISDVAARYCSSPGCSGPTTWADGGGAVLSGNNGAEATLPPGRYRMYLIADQAPVQVTMRLPGISGRTTFRPQQPVRCTIATPAPTQAEPADGPLLFAAGSTRNGIGRRGVYVSQLTWKDEPLAHEWTAWTDSFYLGRPPSGPTPAYQQGAGGNVIVPIIGGNNASGKARVVAAGTSAPYYIGSFFTFGGYVRNDARPLNQVSTGVSGNTDGPVYDAHYSVLWLDRQ